jgi:carbonic anhydrase/SulP family sulfate permease
VVASLRRESRAIDALAREGRIAIIGAMYDVATGDIEFLPATEHHAERAPSPV